MKDVLNKFNAYQERLYTGTEIPVDEKWKNSHWWFRNASWCSRKVAKLWIEAVTENLSEIGDLEGYRKDFIIYLDLT
jgi:enoyl-[acyl-carrier protein] reductase/trans-2-enoyl-CoA reductase (NAD+)